MAWSPHAIIHHRMQPILNILLEKLSHICRILGECELNKNYNNFSCVKPKKKANEHAKYACILFLHIDGAYINWLANILILGKLRKATIL